MPLISIVIPVYNRPELIVPGLDSIYNQCLENDQFEVILVNNGSPDPEVERICNSYTYHEIRPDNLHIISVAKNNRGGSGRNAGIRAATGKYILHRDHDDIFLPNALKSILSELKCHPELDMLIYDCEIRKYENFDYIEGMGHASNSQSIMSGEEYLITQMAPTYLWVAAYRKDFILENSLFVCEGVILEDTDYVNNCLIRAKKVCYKPIPAVCYYQFGKQLQNTSANFAKPELIESLLQLGERLFNIHSETKSQFPNGANVLKGLYEYQYHSVIALYLWQRPYREIVTTLRKHPLLVETSNNLTNFASHHPKLYALVSVVSAPARKTAINVYRRILEGRNPLAKAFVKTYRKLKS